MKARRQTPAQTVGPYFSMCLVREGQNHLRAAGVQGEPIRIVGRVLDGRREAIDDALVELWQADDRGHYFDAADLAHTQGRAPRFVGFGRSPTDHEGATYRFDTIRPGSVSDHQGVAQAPHLNLIVHARGMLLPSFTRVYFEDRPDDNARDPLLRSLPAPRRATLIAKLESDAPKIFRFDICFQGDDETVFLDF
jgi:protocatechuate 3,4-dioxygenase alpha subunit